MITYEQLEGISSSSLEVTLSGEGVIPQVSLTYPEFNNELDRYTINVNPTFIKESLSNSIRFQNVGTIPCDVIIEICEGTSDMFTLIPHNDTIPSLRIVEKGN